MPSATPQTDWIELTKAVDDAFAYGRFLPRRAKRWERRAKKVTAQNINEFRSRLENDLFKDLVIYYNKIMTFDPILLTRINSFPEEKKGEAGLILNSLPKEREKRQRGIKELSKSKDSEFLGEAKLFLTNFKKELRMTQHHLKELKKILKKAAKAEKKKAEPERKKR